MNCIVVIDTLRSLSNFLNCKQSLLVMKDRYFKFSRALSTSKTTAWPIASLIMDNLRTLYEIPSHVFTDKELPNKSKLFET